MTKNLIFYDGTCGLCDHLVQFVLRHDSHESFDFASLQGSTAKEMLQELPPEMKTSDSLVLIENYKMHDRRFFILGKGALRICWLLGGLWTVIGIFSFLPAIFYDWGYRLVAKNRHRFFSNNSCILPKPETHNRFLP